MKREPKWISKQAVLAFHEQLLSVHGGASGVLDEGLLDAALASPKNHFAYERADTLRLAAAYAYSLTQNHPFADGNKRVALTVAGVFMELNGFRLEATEQDAAQATRALSMRELSEVEFADWLRTCSSKLSVARRGPLVKVLPKRRKQRKSQ
ncbi:MAG: type II toxin-antitoxin system death-on-curing family toxin [Candidatus Eisenbacteria bacterium]|uniref:Type II toxin-antitoxin system death-on-curing family toxin n=1 Tax=Eiseniibacteriota bacterium TaxID=2212470 RepID=A0A849SJI6_UNCEI|nr:type II toxin-antitoxin system death-on-curing family toxin [Candidatus Eisenbacteria bacterium]